MPFVINVQKIKDLMQSKNITDKQLLVLLKDVDPASLWRLLNNKTKSCSRLHITARLAKAFNLPIEDIIKEEN